MKQQTTESRSGKTYGSGIARFHYNHVGNRPDRKEASVRATHPASIEGRSLFAKSVIVPTKHDNVLISGMNSAKIGRVVTKGPWTGLPIYTLTLEERKTCPRSCDLWQACYGNAMPFAKRWAYSPKFQAALFRSLTERSAENPKGFVVRLHVLGDFPDEAYVCRWSGWLSAFTPKLHVFGYTHHPAESEIGKLIGYMNALYPSHCRIRFSVPPTAPHAPLQATTIWQPDISSDQRRVPEGVICPAQRDATATCGTCGLCWAPAADDQRIVFLGHGMRTRKGKSGAKIE